MTWQLANYKVNHYYCCSGDTASLSPFSTAASYAPTSYCMSPWQFYFSFLFFFFGLAPKLPPPSADANKLSEFTQGFTVADHYIWARLPAKLKYQKQAWTHRGKSLKRRQSVFQAPVNCLSLFAWKMRRCKLKWRAVWTKKSLKL